MDTGGLLKVRVQARRVVVAVVLVALAGIGARLAADHLAWLRFDQAPALGEDSAYHLPGELYWWWSFRGHPSLATFAPKGNYPPLTYWASYAWFALFGASEPGARESQVCFTFVLAVATGWAGFRAGGPGSAVAAAGLTSTWAWLWAERTHVMFMPAAAAGVALALATAPAARGRFRPVLSTVGGLLAGAGTLGHNSGAYAFAGLGLVLGLEWAVETWRAPTWRARWEHGRNLLVWGVGCAAVAALWWPENLGTVLGIVRDHHSKYPILSVEQAQLDLLALFLHEFLLGWQARALGVGLAVAVVAGVRNPHLRRAVVMVLAGYLGPTTFPQIHLRYFLPLVAPATVVALAPLVVLERHAAVPRPRALLALGAGVALAAWGLRFSAGWRVDAPPAQKLTAPRFNVEMPRPEGRTVAQATAAVLAPLTHWQTLAPAPSGGQVDLTPLVDALVARLPLDPPLGQAPLPTLGRAREEARVGSKVRRIPPFRFVAALNARREFRVGAEDVFSPLRCEGPPTTPLFVLHDARTPFREGTVLATVDVRLADDEPPIPLALSVCGRERVPRGS